MQASARRGRLREDSFYERTGLLPARGRRRSRSLRNMDRSPAGVVLLELGTVEAEIGFENLPCVVLAEELARSVKPAVEPRISRNGRGGLKVRTIAD
jgi:hypothetical protein